jgi:hypothetical protein
MSKGNALRVNELIEKEQSVAAELSRMEFTTEHEAACLEVYTLTGWRTSLGVLREAEGQSIENVAVFLQMQLTRALKKIEEETR